MSKRMATRWSVPAVQGHKAAVHTPVGPGNVNLNGAGPDHGVRLPSRGASQRGGAGEPGEETLRGGAGPCPVLGVH